MSNPSPQFFQWSGEAMIPLRPKLADKEYCIGEKYRLGVIEERSTNSHNAYFASVTEAWRNLPDEYAERFPTPDHLRKYALIKCGYHDSNEFACKSNAEALRLVAFLRPIDEYGLILVKDNIVRRFVAKSQSKKAMGKQEFQDSKAKVLDIVATMIGVKREALSDNARAHA